ncbi:MAG: YceD family protein [Bacillota bacterium]
MEINVAKISKVENVREFFKIVDASADREISFYGEAHKIVPPIIVEGFAINYEGKIEVELNISAKIEMICSRCMESYVHNISTTSYFTFARTVNNDDTECHLYKGESIDITDLVLNEIAAEIPMKPLCNTQCKGLCPKCGINKNITDCTCKTDTVDSRLQILSKLLEEEQGGV